MADDPDALVLTGGRRKTIDRITKQMKNELTKLQHKLSDKSSKSDDRDAVKKHDKHKMMKYMWKDLKHQNNRKLQAMLNAGVVHLSELDPQGSLLLHATRHLMKESIQILLENGSPVCCDKETGLSPVHMAVKLGSIAGLAIMIKNGVSIHEVTLYEKKTCLHISVRANNIDIAKYLLNSDADPNLQDIYGCTAMHYAVCTENDELVEMLLSYGADINKLDIGGWAPLHHAVTSGDSYMAKLLIQNKANITAQTNYGKTPLHIACSTNNLPVVDVLVDHDTPTHITDSHGKTPLYYTKHRDIISLLQMCSSSCDDEEPKHITLQIKSKSLVDLLDPEFVNDEFHSTTASSLPVLPTQNKMGFGSLVKHIMKSKGKRHSGIALSDIRARLESFNNIFDQRCNSIDSLQPEDIFGAISDLHTMPEFEDVFDDSAGLKSELDAIQEDDVEDYLENIGPKPELDTTQVHEWKNIGSKPKFDTTQVHDWKNIGPKHEFDTIQVDDWKDISPKSMFDTNQVHDWKNIGPKPKFDTIIKEDDFEDEWENIVHKPEFDTIQENAFEDEWENISINGHTEREHEYTNGYIECENKSTCGHIECENKSTFGHIECENKHTGGHIECTNEIADGNIECDNKSTDGYIEFEKKSTGEHIECENESKDGHIECGNKSKDGHIECDNESTGGHIECTNEIEDGNIECEIESTTGNIVYGNQSTGGHIDCENESTNGHSECENESTGGHIDWENEYTGGHIECENESTGGHHECKNESTGGHIECENESIGGHIDCENKNTGGPIECEHTHMVGQPDIDNQELCSLDIQHKNINNNIPAANGKLCHRSNAFIFKHNQNSLQEEHVKNCIFNHIDDCLNSITSVIGQLDTIKRAGNNKKQHHKLDDLQSYIYGWRNNTENFKQDLIQSLK